MIGLHPLSVLYIPPPPAVALFSVMLLLAMVGEELEQYIPPTILRGLP